MQLKSFALVADGDFRLALPENEICFLLITLEGCGPCEEIKAAFYALPDVDTARFFMLTLDNFELAEKLVNELQIKEFPSLVMFSNKKSVFKRWSGFYSNMPFEEKVEKLNINIQNAINSLAKTGT